MFFNSLMGFLRAQSLVHSFLPYVRPLLVQSYLNSMLSITYMQMIPKLTWNLTLGTSSTTELVNCLQAVQAWKGNNKLKLNPDKMEFIVIGDDKIRSSMKSSFPISFLGNIMEPAESVKTLVSSWMVTINWLIYVGLSLFYYLLRELQRVHRYLNYETAVKAENALVSSCMDYCNSLFYHTKRHILSDYKEFKMS